MAFVCVYRTKFAGAKGIFVERSYMEAKERGWQFISLLQASLFPRYKSESSIVCSFICLGSKGRDPRTRFPKRAKSHLIGGDHTGEELSFLPSFHQISELIKPLPFCFVCLSKLILCLIATLLADFHSKIYPDPT